MQITLLNRNRLIHSYSAWEGNRGMATVVSKDIRYIGEQIRVVWRIQMKDPQAHTI